ncbi:MAG TPA: glycosyltransferase family 4 protein [Stellaceae bacterium]|nr:glycosyltransferase family 4 protein [Stellaceae bacterium]
MAEAFSVEAGAGPAEQRRHGHIRAPNRAAGAVAFVLKGYPRLSETFIAQEIRALESRGLAIHIVSLRWPTDRKQHPMHAEIKAPVLYLPEYLWRGPLRVIAGWRAVRHRAGYKAAVRAFLGDLRRDPTPNRIRRFGQALVLARELSPEVGALHAHFMHTPASVARYAAMILELPWSLSAHAKDIWITPEWEKREKLAACAWAVTCTAAGAMHLRALAPEPDRVLLVHHGLDPHRFPSPAAAPSRRDGSDPTAPVRLLSIGRAVEKKGYEDLLQALALLPRGLHWRFVHVGGGARLKRLKRLAERLGLSSRIEWRGAQAQEAVLVAYREADLFVLASRVAADGDRDGLPNVLMEALSQRLAVVASDLPGITELIEDGATGALTRPGDPTGLAGILARLIADPETRARFGSSGASLVRSRFQLDRGIDVLATRFHLPSLSKATTASEEVQVIPPGGAVLAAQSSQ